TARSIVDSSANVIEQLGGVLYFVQDHWRRQVPEKATRVGTYTGNDVGVLQQHVRGSREELPEQGGFAALSRTGQEQRREAARGFHDLNFQYSPNVVHTENSKVLLYISQGRTSCRAGGSFGRWSGLCGRSRHRRKVDTMDNVVLDTAQDASR